jgi:hypothetical protein
MSFISTPMTAPSNNAGSQIHKDHLYLGHIHPIITKLHQRDRADLA